MAVAYDGGVVLGADSRTSTGAPGERRQNATATPAASLCAGQPARPGGARVRLRFGCTRTLNKRPPLLLPCCACSRVRAPGSYVANRVADKISILADNVYICRSGSVRILRAAGRTPVRSGRLRCCRGALAFGFLGGAQTRQP
jgi:hypothetical protein